MKKRIFLTITLAAALVAGCQKEEITPTIEDEVTTQVDNQVVPGCYIITFTGSSTTKGGDVGTYEKRLNAVQEYATSMLKEYEICADSISDVYCCAVKGFAVKLTDEQLSLLKNDSRIALIEQDRYISLDDDVETTASSGAKGQTTPWGITRVGGSVTYTGSNKAWIIDTGVDLDHPDLNVNTTLSKNFVDTRKTADDDNGHGSHVAGIIAAIDNSVGVVGVAAGAPVVAVKVLDRNGSGTYSKIISGIDYVAANGTAGDVANMSLGGTAYTTLDNAVLTASNLGIWFTLAAGNNGANANNYSPARVNGTYIYTISACNSSDVFASWSNYGNPPVDYAAPGVSIYSCYKNAGYATMSGTSMAAPHAAGVRLLGTPTTDGYVTGDLDSNPDPIIHE